MSIRTITRRTADEAFSAREDCTNSGRTLRGYREPILANGLFRKDGPMVGQLPEPHREAFKDAVTRGAIAYVVYSYDTPIAWVEDNVWVIPDVRYSVTTSCHQGLARMGAHYDTGMYVSESGHDSMCGTCRRSWDASATPTPSGRCPFESDHK